MSRLAIATLVAVSSGAMGCGVILDQWPRRPQVQGISQTIAELVRGAPIESAGVDESVAVLGFRDEDGQQTGETRLLDEFLLDALLRRRAPVAPGIGTMRMESEKASSWEADAMLPGQWQELPSARLLSGKVYHDSPWAYVRLMLTDKHSGAIMHSQVARLTERELARAAEEFAERAPAGEAAAFVVNVDLHTILWRVSGSFTDSVPLDEGVTVAVGDRMQLRYTTDADCAVWAFLFRSDGVRHDLIDLNTVYAGHDQIVETFTFEAENVVHTLYFVAAEDIETDRSDLFEQIGELVRRGEIHRFRGLDLIDGKLASFFSAGGEGEPPIEVLRGREGIEVGAEEKFTVGEANLVSKPERLTGTPVLLRAVSFDVQIR